MTYSMYRTRDGAGDSGPMSTAFTPVYDTDTNKIVDVVTEDNARPKLGASMRVGSPYARSYSAQDWWQTTLVTEIVEEKIVDGAEYVRFKTGNSEYEWKSF